MFFIYSGYFPIGKPRPVCLGSGFVLRCVYFWVSKRKGLGLLFPSSGQALCFLGRNFQDLTGFQRTPCSARLGQVTRVTAVSELRGPCRWDVEWVALSPPQALAGPAACQLLGAPARSLPRASAPAPRGGKP